MTMTSIDDHDPSRDGLAAAIPLAEQTAETEVGPPVGPPGDDTPGGSVTVESETEVELIPLHRVEDVTDEDRRIDLYDLNDIPVDDPVGLVDASSAASTQTANVLVDAAYDVALDTFVVSAQRLADGSGLFHYGIVTEVSTRVEGAEMITDTDRLAKATLPGERYRCAEVRWYRTDPEHFLPSASGAPVWIATGDHRDMALFLDKMESEEKIPIGVDMTGQPVYIPYGFLSGESGAHVSISGKSGIATKTSYALYLLYVLFETTLGRTARGMNAAHDRAIVFSVKGADLMLLDKPNAKFGFGDEGDVEAREMWRTIRAGDDDTPQPFSDIEVFAPAMPGNPDDEVTADVSVRELAATSAYGWTPADFIVGGLLEYVFDDLESGQLSFIEQVVRLELLRWAWPVSGATDGRIVLVEPDPGEPHIWETAADRFAGYKTSRPKAEGDGTVVKTLDEIVAFITTKLTDLDHPDPHWNGGVTQGTVQAFVRRLWKALPRLRRLVRVGLTEPGENASVSVVDVHNLHADAQRFVVSTVLAAVWVRHDGSTAAGRTFVLLDELNKYAPRQGQSPIKDLLIDIAARGRSLGVILIGAQQNPSGVSEEILNNAALEVTGQIKASEGSGLGFLSRLMQDRAQILAPGTMITNQPLLPAPVPVRFPFPPYATRASEVAEDPASDDRAEETLNQP